MSHIPLPRSSPEVHGPHECTPRKSLGGSGYEVLTEDGHVVNQHGWCQKVICRVPGLGSRYHTYSKVAHELRLAPQRTRFTESLSSTQHRIRGAGWLIR